MRTLLVIATMLAVAFAGCTSGSDGDADEQTDENTYRGPGANGEGTLLAEAPWADAGEILIDLKLWAETNNVRRNNVATHEQSRIDLMALMDGYGLEVYRQNFTDGIDQANIVGIKWGEIRDQWVVVGGHYDTTTIDCVAGDASGQGAPACPSEQTSQGMYDDGSGTMLTIHMAKAFANTSTKYTMAFVALDGEERGTNGARAFVNDFVTGGPDEAFPTPYGQIKVVGALDLDMIGLNWPGVHNPINVLTNSEALWEETDFKMKEMGAPEEEYIRKDSLTLGSSDYARFWEVTEEQGGPIPTIFFIAGFEETGTPSPGSDEGASAPAGYYPWWHFQDNWETMNAMAGGEENTELGFQTAANLSTHILWKLAAEPTFMPDACTHGNDYPDCVYEEPQPVPSE